MKILTEWPKTRWVPYATAVHNDIDTSIQEGVNGFN